MLILDPDYTALKGDADGPPDISIMRPDNTKKEQTGLIWWLVNI